VIRDPREVFADWLISPQNPWFARNIVNRVPGHGSLGRGIIHEPDDIRRRQSAEQSRAAGLPGEGAGRQPLRSEAPLPADLQLAARTSFPPSPRSRQSAVQAEANFANYLLRRLEAEVLIDAVNEITGESDLYTSAIPEPFTYIPRDMPAMALADGSITSPFLTLFGRSARATGMESRAQQQAGCPPSGCTC
jgi:hypothetical protein